MLDLNLTLIVQMVSFLVFAGLLDRLFFRPVLRHMEQRERFLQERRTEIERLNQETRGLVTEQQQRLVDAQRSAQAVVDKAVAEARAEKAGVVAAATQEAAASLDQARKALTEERDRALGSLDGEVERIAERIVGQVLSSDRAREGASA